MAGKSLERWRRPIRRRDGVLVVAALLTIAGACGAPGAWRAIQATGLSETPSALAAPLPGAREVSARYVFGMQYVPKFDEAKGEGAWSGTRARGIAFHRDLGVQLSREGFLWRHYEPTAGAHPTQPDFDDAIARLAAAGIGVQAMVTETPLWASTATHADPKKPETYKSGVPRGLEKPIFTDGTDTPGPGKRVNPANTWAAALDHMARRYQGKIRYWQMWNEPDYPAGAQGADCTDPKRSFFGSVDDYVRLLKVGATIVRWRDPGAQVVTGGIAYPAYLQAMLDRGAGAWFDQVDFHAYGWPGSDTALAAFVKVHDGLKAVLARNGLANKRLICSETGYTANASGVQAAYIAKLYPTAIAMGLESTMYYANVNPSWKQMGLIDWRTMSQKTPGYWAYKTAATALGDVVRVAPLGLAGAQGYRFERADGSRVVVLWAAPGQADANGRCKPGQASVALPLASWGGGSWRRISATGEEGERLSGAPRVALSETPLYLEQGGRAYAAPATNPRLATGGVPLVEALADSTNDNHGAPDAAIDGDLDTNWVSGGNRAPESWWTARLERPGPLAALTIKTGPTPPGTAFDVEVSTDGGRTFAVAASGRKLSGWQPETIELGAPARSPVTHLRLRWRNPARAQVSFSVFELQAR